MTAERVTNADKWDWGLGVRARPDFGGVTSTCSPPSREYVLSTTMRRQHNNPRRCHTNHEEGELASRHLYTSYEWEEGKGGLVESGWIVLVSGTDQGSHITFADPRYQSCRHIPFRDPQSGPSRPPWTCQVRSLYIAPHLDATSASSSRSQGT